MSSAIVAWSPLSLSRSFPVARLAQISADAARERFLHVPYIDGTIRKLELFGRTRILGKVNANCEPPALRASRVNSEPPALRASRVSGGRRKTNFSAHADFASYDS
jgi:hypothetical protein